MRVRMDACIATAVCVLALLWHRLLRRPDPSAEAFARYGECVYNFWWPALKELGDFIVKARIERQSKEAAWQRWTAINSTGSMPPVRRFNGTEARFMELWDTRQCPPGPCGPRGAPCPRQFPGFRCGVHEPCCGAYCCDDAGCYEDSCDNDGCFPFYQPCDDVHCGAPGECECRRWWAYIRAHFVLTFGVGGNATARSIRRHAEDDDTLELEARL